MTQFREGVFLLLAYPPPFPPPNLWADPERPILNGAKDPNEEKYQYLIKKRESDGLKNMKDPKAFIEY